ncbi:hypothetical protein HU200_045556 [Digitaria exilis]|uniref:Sugar phosphate transporter domain-containing protein n=1 Tax=Digitaria exilis TaxID=1010633 RepID=A0A835AZL7_9POAL|nr:hypothetical protein HU200_045556 [Digitaria exilis]
MSGGGQGRLFTVGLVTAWYSSNIGVLLLNKYLLSNYGFKYPHLPHHVPHGRLLPLLLRRHRLAPPRPHAAPSLPPPARQDRRPQPRLLRLRRLGQHLPPLPPRLLQPGRRRHHPLLHRRLRYLMTVKRESFLTYLALVPVVTGVIIASGGEPSFNLFGFIMCVGATAARALKTVLQGILMSSDGEKINSMNLLMYMAPIAVVLLAPATIFMEDNVVAITMELAKDLNIVWYLLVNSSLAYFVNLTNFLVTKHTSALTLQVLGNAKGAVAVVISILIFRNPVSVTRMLGYTLTVIGVLRGSLQ